MGTLDRTLTQFKPAGYNARGGLFEDQGKLAVTIEIEEKLRQQAWQVYGQHLSVLQSALHGIGGLGVLDATDLLHDFLVDRLPSALASYDPQVGPIEPWLYAVFRRYVNRCLREDAVSRKKWSSLHGWEGAIKGTTDKTEPLSPGLVAYVRDALARLPDQMRLVLLAYFGTGGDSGSERALARMLHVSRYAVRRQLLIALCDLATQLRDTRLFSAKELRACQDRLVESRKWEDIATDIGTSRDEAESLVRNVLITLGTALTQCGQAQNTDSGSAEMGAGRIRQVDAGRIKFDELLQALREGNERRVDDLSTDWRAIFDFLTEHPDAADGANLSENTRTALILWLSTAPSPDPIRWADLTDVPSFVLGEREQQVALVNQLWNAWLSNTIEGALKCAFSQAEFKYGAPWCQKTHLLVDHARSVLNRPEFEDEDARLDVVAGYGAFVDEVLLKFGAPLNEATIEVRAHELHCPLVLPDSTKIPCEGVGRAIAFRYGALDEKIRIDEATHPFALLASVISLSLPAHQEVLPLVSVRLDNQSCRLFSGRGERLENFLRE
jgi:hypothetical protein